jgi:RNA polymerase sigma-70 factor, ECF subfamily
VPLPPAGLAEEITQGAFLLAWRGWPRFKGCPFRPWLMRILYRHALDVMDKQGAYLRPLSLDEALAPADLVGPQRHLGQVDPQGQVAEVGWCWQWQARSLAFHADTLMVR